MHDMDQLTIGVIGLGYVGLPVAVAFGGQFKTIGFDINHSRIDALAQGIDDTREVSAGELTASKHLSFTASSQDLSACNFFVVTVPTPIDAYKRPDLTPLIKASQSIGQVLKKGDIVVYESTVYPGATEEDCVPQLEAASGLVFNQDFFVGYSPERINPGDKSHRLADIVKVTSGSTPEVADFIDQVYGSIITASTHKAASIKIAEASKVIENTQRDVNIALINELSLICERLDIDTHEVLNAAATKWNFLPFKPGLVGGHCIGVDPYYLTHKAQQLGYTPEIILAGRRINDNMGRQWAARLAKSMAKQGQALSTARVLILGLTFKENCPDLRNTLVVSMVHELQDYGLNVDVADCHAKKEEALSYYGINLQDLAPPLPYDGIVLAVSHREYLAMGIEAIRALSTNPQALVFDLKAVLPKEQVDLRP